MGNNIDHATRLEEILAEWDLDEAKGYETMTSVTSPVSLDLSNTFSNVSLTSPYTVSSGINFPNTIYTTASNTTGITIGAQGSGGNVPWLTQSPFSAPKIQLNGEGADVEVNGWSLVAAVKSIEQRLAIMQPNTELESEWEELKQLGDQYRKLEQHIQNKQATWDKLKAMPPPEID
jgi:hypothetical protein